MVHIASSATPEFLAIRTTLRKVRVRLGEISRAQQTRNSSWAVGVDARLTGFAKLANVIESTELALKFLDEILSTEAWWRQNYGALATTKDREIAIVEFSYFVKAGLLQLGFGALESTFRILLRRIDQVACAGSTAEFKSVYECLLRSKIPTLHTSIALLDLLRLLRNTVHNNGVHYHSSGTDIEIEYQGARYAFRVGRPIEFATWALIASLFADVVELLNAVVSAPEVASLAGSVPDPFC